MALNLSGLLKAGGAGFQGYGQDKQRMAAEAVQAAQMERQRKQDATLAAMQAKAAARPKLIADLFGRARTGDVAAQNDLVGEDSSFADDFRLPKPVVPPADEIEFRDGQKVNLTKGTASPIENYVKPTVAPRPVSDAQQAAMTARSAAREDRLQQNFEGNPAVKQGALMANAVAQLRASASQKTPQGDLGMIYGTIKLLDPASVVKEGEVNLVRMARSLGTQAVGIWKKANEGRLLTDGERQQMMALLDAAVSEQGKLVDPVMARFGKQAREAGGDSSYVAPDPLGAVRPKPLPNPDAWLAAQLKLQKPPGKR